MKGTTLGLDLGKSRTGWAIMKDTQLIECGHQTFMRMDVPQLFDGITGLLEDMRLRSGRNNHDLATVVFEAAEHQQGMAREAYCTMATAVRVYARSHRMRVAKVYSGTVKKIVTGYGASDKPAMVRAVNDTFSLTLDPDKRGPDHNVADAIGVGLTAWTLDALGELDYI